MSVPAKIYVGDTVAWVDADVPAETTAVNVYFRTNTAGAGVVATGAQDEDTWTVTLAAAATETMVEGSWAFQAVATTPSGLQTYGTGRVEVVASFAFTGTPEAVDLRSQAEKDLDAVEEAIRVLSSGAQSYTIGTATGGRTFTRANLANLVAWRDRLVAKVAAERQADGAYRTDRRILARFD